MRKLINNIVKNRFLISLIFVLIVSTVSLLLNYQNYGLGWITNTDSTFSLWINIKFVGLFLVLYELFFIITNENKNLSFYGSIIVLFSSAIAYNLTKIDSLILGSLIIVLLNKLFTEDSNNKIILYSILIILASLCYSYTFVPYAVAFGYFFIGLIIYVTLKNKSILKESKFKRITLYVTIFLSTMLMTVSKLVIKNTYIEVVTEKFNGFELMFSYLYSVLLPFNNIANKELLSSFIGVAPVPMFIALYYIYKNEKHTEFLFPITLFAVIETVFALTNLPETIKGLLFLNNVSSARIIDAIQLSNLFIIFYFISNVKEKLFSVKVSMRITIVFLLLLILVSFPKEFSGRLALSLFIFEETLFTFLFLNMEEESYIKVLVFFLVIFSLLGSIPVYFLL